MNFSKKMLICAFSAISLLVGGCGDSGSSSESNPSNSTDTTDTTDPTDSGEAAETPDTPSFKVSGCEDATDEATSKKMESAKADIADLLQSLGKGDFSNAQKISAQTKSTFKSVLDQYPSNCEAQLGYALGIVTDLVNNAEIKAFIDTVSNKKDLIDMDVNDFNKILVTGDGKLLTSEAQTAMAQAIPSIDSAVIYMRNIVNEKDFTCTYTYEDRTYELDRGEFAPALGALFVAKSILTFGASLNIDISDNKSFDWMNEADQLGDYDAPVLTMKQVEKLLDKKSSFTTVYDNWKSSYKKIPDLLDSAITYVELGLEYGIEESKEGTKTQLNDPYIVGDGEMADVRVADFEKAIDSLEYYRQSLHSGVEVTLPHGSKVTVNIAKFFEITDGFQQFVPYHHFNESSEWYIPVDGFFWYAEPDADNYAKREIDIAIKTEIEKKLKIESFDTWISEPYSWDDEEFDYDWQICADIEFEDGYDYKCFSMTFDGCTVSFGATSDVSDDEGLVVSVPSPVKLSSDVCKVEDGETLFATAIQNTVENYFYFTDADGKKTLSLQALENGYVDGEYLRDYTIRDLSKYIFFPDVTFGGVFPGMTKDKFWDILATEFEDDDREDEDW